MKTIELSEVAALVPLVDSGDREPVFVTQQGETVAAIVPTNAEDAESLLLSINPKFQELLERSEYRLKSEGAVSSADVRQRLGMPASE